MNDKRVVSLSDELYRLFMMLAAGILIGITIGQYLLPVCH